MPVLSIFLRKPSGIFLWILRSFEEHFFIEHLWWLLLLLRILRGKIQYNSLSSVQEWFLGCFWPFHMFTQSIKFYTYHYYILKKEKWFMKWTIKMNDCSFQQPPEHRTYNERTWDVQKTSCGYREKLRQNLGWF